MKLMKEMAAEIQLVINNYPLNFDCLEHAKQVCEETANNYSSMNQDLVLTVKQVTDALEMESELQ